jgi:hypothetical protein
LQIQHLLNLEVIIFGHCSCRILDDTALVLGGFRFPMIKLIIYISTPRVDVDIKINECSEDVHFIFEFIVERGVVEIFGQGLQKGCHNPQPEMLLDVVIKTSLLLDEQPDLRVLVLQLANQFKVLAQCHYAFLQCSALTLLKMLEAIHLMLNVSLE